MRFLLKVTEHSARAHTQQRQRRYRIQLFAGHFVFAYKRNGAQSPRRRAKKKFKWARVWAIEFIETRDECRFHRHLSLHETTLYICVICSIVALWGLDVSAILAFEFRLEVPVPVDGGEKLTGKSCRFSENSVALIALTSSLASPRNASFSAFVSLLLRSSRLLLRFLRF